MKKLTFEDIEKQGLLLYRYYRGSYTYGTYVEGVSDKDEGGVYLEPIEQIIGLGHDFQEQVQDAKGDTVWYSLKKFMNLLIVSNPTVLEALFIPDEYVIYEHPIMTEIKKHRQEFITKACFNSFSGYAISQIKKCGGQNKLIVNPIKKRLWPLDFCYTTYKQGSANMREWLAHRGLEQKYCGLVSLNNMPSCFSVFYDWGQHIADKKIDFDMLLQESYDNPREGSEICKFANFITSAVMRQTLEYEEYSDVLLEWYNNHKEPHFYRGIVAEDGRSDEVRCSSVEKDEMPICMLCFNINGYGTHCKKYKEYSDWVKNRNKARYESNLGHNYDSKNMSHSFRLLRMGKEVAETGEFNVDRRNIDADFLLSVRNHEFEYEYVIDKAEKEFNEMEEAMNNSSLPEDVDREMVNNLILDIRRKYQLNENCNSGK